MVVLLDGHLVEYWVESWVDEMVDMLVEMKAVLRVGWKEMNWAAQ